MSPTAFPGAPTPTNTGSSMASSHPAGKEKTVPFALLGVFGFVAVFGIAAFIGKWYSARIKQRKIAAARKQRQTSRGKQSKQSSRRKRQGSWVKLANKEVDEQTPLPTRPRIGASTPPGTPPRSPAPARTPRLNKSAFLSRPEISSPLAMDPLSPCQSNEPSAKRPSASTSDSPRSPLLTSQDIKSLAPTMAERRVRQMRSNPKLSPVQKATPLL